MKFSSSICVVDSILPIEVKNGQIFKNDNLQIIFGDYNEILEQIHYYNITRYKFINLSKNSLFPLIDYSSLSCRVEYGAIIRDKVKLEKNCIILMGAVVNVGASIGENTMVDMNAVIGSNAKVGKNCHIGAGAVISGTMEPYSSKPVVIKDNTFIGANSVILEGITIGSNVIIGASSLVTKDIPDNVVAYGVPAKIKRIVKENDINKIQKELR